MVNGEKKTGHELGDPPRGTVELSISGENGLKGTMTGELVLDKNSQFIAQLLDLVDDDKPTGPITIAYAEPIQDTGSSYPGQPTGSAVHGCHAAIKDNKPPEGATDTAKANRRGPESCISKPGAVQEEPIVEYARIQAGGIPSENNQPSFSPEPNHFVNHQLGNETYQQNPTDGRLTSGYSYSNYYYPYPYGVGNCTSGGSCSYAPYGYFPPSYCRQVLPIEDRVDLGNHSSNIKGLVKGIQADVQCIRSNLCSTTCENIHYMKDNNYRVVTLIDNCEQHNVNQSDRKFLEQRLCYIPSMVCSPYCCPPPCQPCCCYQLQTTEAFSRDSKEQRVDQTPAGCAEIREAEEAHFRRTSMPVVGGTESPSFRDNKVLQFASGQDTVEGEELYSQHRKHQSFARSNAYGLCYEKRAIEDKDLKRRSGCPLHLPHPRFGVKSCDVNPLSGGNAAVGPAEYTNAWDVLYPKEEIFAHHVQNYNAEQTCAGFSESNDEQKEFKRTSRPLVCDRRCLALNTGELTMIDRGDVEVLRHSKERSAKKDFKGDVDLADSEMREDRRILHGPKGTNENSTFDDPSNPKPANVFTPCAGTGNAEVSRRYKMRKVDRDCTGKVDVVETEVQQEHVHSTLWGTGGMAPKGSGSKGSRKKDKRMSCGADELVKPRMPCGADEVIKPRVPFSDPEEKMASGVGEDSGDEQASGLEGDSDEKVVAEERLASGTDKASGERLASGADKINHSSLPTERDQVLYSSVPSVPRQLHPNMAAGGDGTADVFIASEDENHVYNRCSNETLAILERDAKQVIRQIAASVENEIGDEYASGVKQFRQDGQLHSGCSKPNTQEQLTGGTRTTSNLVLKESAADCNAQELNGKLYDPSSSTASGELEIECIDVYNMVGLNEEGLLTATELEALHSTTPVHQKTSLLVNNLLNKTTPADAAATQRAPPYIPKLNLNSVDSSHLHGTDSPPSSPSKSGFTSPPCMHRQESQPSITKSVHATPSLICPSVTPFGNAKNVASSTRLSQQDFLSRAFPHLTPRDCKNQHRKLSTRCGNLGHGKFGFSKKRPSEATIYPQDVVDNDAVNDFVTNLCAGADKYDGSEVCICHDYGVCGDTGDISITVDNKEPRATKSCISPLRVRLYPELRALDSETSVIGNVAVNKQFDASESDSRSQAPKESVPGLKPGICSSSIQLFKREICDADNQTSKPGEVVKKVKLFGSRPSVSLAGTSGPEDASKELSNILRPFHIGSRSAELWVGTELDNGDNPTVDTEKNGKDDHPENSDRLRAGSDKPYVSPEVVPRLNSSKNWHGFCKEHVPTACSCYDNDAIETQATTCALELMQESQDQPEASGSPHDAEGKEVGQGASAKIGSADDVFRTRLYHFQTVEFQDGDAIDEVLQSAAPLLVGVSKCWPLLEDEAVKYLLTILIHNLTYLISFSSELSTIIFKSEVLSRHKTGLVTYPVCCMRTDAEDTGIGYCANICNSFDSFLENFNGLAPYKVGDVYVDMLLDNLRGIMNDVLDFPCGVGKLVAEAVFRVIRLQHLVPKEWVDLYESNAVSEFQMYFNERISSLESSANNSTPDQAMKKSTSDNFVFQNEATGDSVYSNGHDAGDVDHSPLSAGSDDGTCTRRTSGSSKNGDAPFSPNKHEKSSSEDEMAAEELGLDDLVQQFSKALRGTKYGYENDATSFPGKQTEADANLSKEIASLLFPDSDTTQLDSQRSNKSSRKGRISSGAEVRRISSETSVPGSVRTSGSCVSLITQLKQQETFPVWSPETAELYALCMGVFGPHGDKPNDPAGLQSADDQFIDFRGDAKTGQNTHETMSADGSPRSDNITLIPKLNIGQPSYGSSQFHDYDRFVDESTLEASSFPDFRLSPTSDRCQTKMAEGENRSSDQKLEDLFTSDELRQRLLEILNQGDEIGSCGSQAEKLRCMEQILKEIGIDMSPRSLLEKLSAGLDMGSPSDGSRGKAGGPPSCQQSGSPCASSPWSSTGSPCSPAPCSPTTCGPQPPTDGVVMTPDADHLSKLLQNKLSRLQKIQEETQSFIGGNYNTPKCAVRSVNTYDKLQAVRSIPGKVLVEYGPQFQGKCLHLYVEDNSPVDCNPEARGTDNIRRKIIQGVLEFIGDNSEWLRQSVAKGGAGRDDSCAVNLDVGGSFKPSKIDAKEASMTITDLEFNSTSVLKHPATRVWTDEEDCYWPDPDVNQPQ